jgi:hypothetical protein
MDDMMKKPAYKRVNILVAVLCLWVFAGSAVAGDGIDRTRGYYPLAALVKVEYKGQAFSVNTKDGFMVVSQVKVNVVNGFTLKDGTPITTVLLDENGKAIALSAFKDYQRVWVTGYRGTDGYMFATKIQRQRLLPKDKLGPDVIPQ